MTSMLTLAANLMTAIPCDVAPPGPLEGGSSGSDWVAPAIGALTVAVLIAFVVVAIVLIRRRR